MPWQDWIFFFGSLVFVLSLIPMLKSKEKPPLLTSLPSAFFLSIFAATQLTLNLKLSALATLIIACQWWTLAYQKFQMHRTEKT